MFLSKVRNLSWKGPWRLSQITGFRVSGTRFVDKLVSLFLQDHSLSLQFLSIEHSLHFGASLLAYQYGPGCLIEPLKNQACIRFLLFSLIQIYFVFTLITLHLRLSLAFYRVFDSGTGIQTLLEGSESSWEFGF